VPTDTRNERGAAIGFPLPLVFPEPDGDLDEREDRRQVNFAYPGIVEAAPPSASTIQSNRLSITLSIGL
jgi:hypothetical protein